MAMKKKYIAPKVRPIQVSYEMILAGSQTIGYSESKASHDYDVLSKRGSQIIIDDEEE